MRLAFSIAHSSLAVAALSLFLAGCAAPVQYRHALTVDASAETQPVPSRADAADDPAIWISPDNPAQSLVLGTDKGSGLVVYSLAGEQLQYIPTGKLNNVDLRVMPWQPDRTLIAATQRDPAKLVLLTLDHESRNVAVQIKHDVEIAEPYGICMYQHGPDDLQIIMNGKSGRFIQYRVNSEYAITSLRSWRTQTQPEGCVADDLHKTIYFGEEARGVWRVVGDPAQPATPEGFASVDSGQLVADVEGLALYQSEDERVLVVSSQGDHSYALYNVTDGNYLGSFHVVAGAATDGTSATDGLDVTAQPLPGYPEGLLVVQDDQNTAPRAQQNFKLVSWAKVRALYRR